MKYPNKKNKGQFLFWMATTWIIWKARNNMIFNGEVMDTLNVVNQIKHISWGWYMGKAGGAAGVIISDWWNSPFHCINV